MTMPGRNTNVGDYRYAYNGMEVDNEVKGNGNSYDYGARMYDPRLGRWFASDRYKFIYTSTSQYSYALNSPIFAKDYNGDYTIFINGYVYGSKRGKSDDIKPGKEYWRSRGDQFIDAAHDYFGDGIGKYFNGSGNGIFSTPGSRHRYGKRLGKRIARDIIREIKEHNEKNKDNPITEINFVSHSMGAATAEGIIEEFMKDDELREFVENGEIVHFSPADADGIMISRNTEHLKRTQINYRGDMTLAVADPQGGLTGGYLISDVKRVGIVKSDLKIMHPKADQHRLWDFHFDSKTYKQAWDFLKLLDKKLGENPKLEGQPIYLDPNEIGPVDSEIKQGNKSSEENRG